MARDGYHGKLNMFSKVDEEEQAIYRTYRSVRKIEIEITESEIIALINAIPKVELFNSPEYSSASSLLDLIQKLREAWNVGTAELD